VPLALAEYAIDLALSRAFFQPLDRADIWLGRSLFNGSANLRPCQVNAAAWDQFPLLGQRFQAPLGKYHQVKFLPACEAARNGIRRISNRGAIGADDGMARGLLVNGNEFFVGFCEGPRGDHAQFRCTGALRPQQAENPNTPNATPRKFQNSAHVHAPAAYSPVILRSLKLLILVSAWTTKRLGVLTPMLMEDLGGEILSRGKQPMEEQAGHDREP